MSLVPSLLAQKISDEELRASTDWTRREIKQDVETWFKDTVRYEPAAGNVALFFARVVLSIIGNAEHLDETRKNLVEKLCEVIEHERPLPTVFWSDFVRTQLENPAFPSRVLANCVQDTSYLGTKIGNIVKKNYQKLGRIEDRPILVFGYSATIVAALQGLPPRILQALRVMTPQQNLPTREHSDGELLRTNLKNVSVEVVENAEALRRLQQKEPGLVFMGCKVIGRRENRELEIVNSQYANRYAQAAWEAGVPVGVVTGSYKLWPTSSYEKYRSKLQRNRRNSIIKGELVRWIVTEDDIFSQEDFGGVYDIYFTTDEVPVASVRECLKEKRFRKLKNNPQIIEMAKAAKVFKVLTGPELRFQTIDDITRMIGLPLDGVKVILGEYLEPFMDQIYQELIHLIELRDPDHHDLALEEKIEPGFQRLHSLQKLETDLIHEVLTSQYTESIAPGLDILNRADEIRARYENPPTTDTASQPADTKET